jgi:hypothetical protein
MEILAWGIPILGIPLTFTKAILRRMLSIHFIIPMRSERSRVAQSI